MESADIPFSLEERVIDLADFVGSDRKQREKLDSWRRELRRRFDGSRYASSGREWYQSAFVENFLFMYDKSFYDREEKRYRIDQLLEEGEQEFGGYDFIVLWQAYPRIGIDDRNQFDYYRDMPGGLPGLRGMVDRAHQRRVRVLINYNPWDARTRRKGRPDAELLAEIVQAIGADGVFLDTLASSAPEFRAALERVNPDIVFEPEDVPTPEHSQFITGSWLQTQEPKRPVQPPRLMMNRWIEPRFSFRGIDRITGNRTPNIGVHFFNGCGSVVWENVFGWWNPWDAKDRALLRKCVKLLRDHNDAFRDLDWQPYVKTLMEGVYAHRWKAPRKTVYTLLNTLDRKAEGPILPVSRQDGDTFYDVWSGGEMKTRKAGSETVLAFSLEPSSPGCVVALPADDPAPEAANVQDSAETVYRTRVTLDAVKPRPVSPSARAEKGEEISGMVMVPGGRFVMDVRHNVHAAHEGPCYGDVSSRRSRSHPPQYYWLEPYFVDRTEVTNADYRMFLEASRYCPSELTNFLKSWKRPSGGGSKPWTWEYPGRKDRHPVVWVDLDDARAYARWTGKRLPREEEWQYAAQGPQYNAWPWGRDFDPSLCNSGTDDTTHVEKYPNGASSFGCLDMSGNVWEWTESERDDGHTRYAIVRGGSYLVVPGIFYTSSGAQPCDAHEKMLLVYPGLDRCINIGFRCVKDVGV